MSQRNKAFLVIASVIVALLFLAGVYGEAHAATGGISPDGSTRGEDVPIHVRGTTGGCRIGTYAKRGSNRYRYDYRMLIAVSYRNQDGFRESVNSVRTSGQAAGGSKPHLALTLNARQIAEIPPRGYQVRVRHSISSTLEDPHVGVASATYQHRITIHRDDCARPLTH